MLNVFEHQKFLLRRRSPTDPLGERIELSFKELMTLAEGEDETDSGLHFDYPIEYFNVAALGLCAALAQSIAEPRDIKELAKRIASPFDPDELDRLIAGRREIFSIDSSSGARFMQGREPERDRKGRFDAGPLWELLLTVKKGDKYFLNRPAENWAVRLDQIPLLLFSRATFFEKSAGRGYLTGTSGDLEVRTFPIDRSSLRKTIWLNVLARSEQKEADFASNDTESAYSGFMWHDPPKEDVAQGMLSLVSGLFWMVANAYIVIEETTVERLCIVSGEEIPAGTAGVGVVVSTTGKGYGVKVAREKGPEVRQSFFRHPNGPLEYRRTKEGLPYLRHFAVSETSGLIGNMGGLFYTSEELEEFRMAPVVRQLYALREEYRDGEIHFPPLELDCFGFHMLSSKANVHGGYEHESFHYPLIGRLEENPLYVLTTAQRIMADAASRAESVEEILTEAIQRCTMVQIDTDNKEGHFEFKAKRRLASDELMRDATRDLWNALGLDLRDLLAMIDKHGDTADELNDASDAIAAWWLDRAARHAVRLFLRVFNDYSTSPLYLVAAHDARGRFYARLRKLGVVFGKSGGESETGTPQPTEAML